MPKWAAVLFTSVLLFRTTLASAPPTIVETLRADGGGVAVPDLVVALKERRPGVAPLRTAILNESDKVVCGQMQDDLASLTAVSP